MTAALPGMTTHFSAGRMRRGIEDTLSTRDLHASLREHVVVAGRDSGRETLAPEGAALDRSAPLLARQSSGALLEALAEVALTEIRVRDDGTLSSVSARVRMLRASDGAEVATRAFTYQPAAREYWHLALEEALTALAMAILENVAPTPEVAGLAEVR